MLRKKALVAALLLLGLAVDPFEDALTHTDDGCAVETHCDACLLRLGTTGVTAVAFSLPRLDVAVALVAPPSLVSHADAPARVLPSRGPPLA